MGIKDPFKVFLLIHLVTWYCLFPYFCSGKLTSEVEMLIFISIPYLETCTQVCSGGWDCTISLWQTNEINAEGDQVSVKKKRVNDRAEKSQLEVLPCFFILCQ